MLSEVEFSMLDNKGVGNTTSKKKTMTTKIQYGKSSSKHKVGRHLVTTAIEDDSESLIFGDNPTTHEGQSTRQNAG